MVHTQPDCSAVLLANRYEREQFFGDTLLLVGHLFGGVCCAVLGHFVGYKVARINAYLLGVLGGLKCGCRVKMYVGD